VGFGEEKVAGLLTGAGNGEVATFFSTIGGFGFVTCFTGVGFVTCFTGVGFITCFTGAGFISTTLGDGAFVTIFRFLTGSGTGLLTGGGGATGVGSTMDMLMVFAGMLSISSLLKKPD
jgi:hypothetical protein